MSAIRKQMEKVEDLMEAGKISEGQYLAVLGRLKEKWEDYEKEIRPSVNRAYNISTCLFYQQWRLYGKGNLGSGQRGKPVDADAKRQQKEWINENTLYGRNEHHLLGYIIQSSAGFLSGSIGMDDYKVHELFEPLYQKELTSLAKKWSVSTGTFGTKGCGNPECDGCQMTEKWDFTAIGKEKMPLASALLFHIERRLWIEGFWNATKGGPMAKGRLPKLIKEFCFLGMGREGTEELAYWMKMKDRDHLFDTQTMPGSGQAVCGALSIAENLKHLDSIIEDGDGRSFDDLPPPPLSLNECPLY
jgi:hypothetical protein